jgi:hypothetical protein
MRALESEEVGKVGSQVSVEEFNHSGISIACHRMALLIGIGLVVSVSRALDDLTARRSTRYGDELDDYDGFFLLDQV